MSALYLCASAASPSTGALYLRPAARSANSRSSMRSSSAGSKSAVRNAASRWPRVSSSAVKGGVSAFTVGSTRPGACAARRSRRRITPDSAGTLELAPAITSWASRKSSATFSACIIAVRRSASAVSSPACGASLLSSATAWRSQSPSRLARSTSARWPWSADCACRCAFPQRFDLRGLILEPSKSVKEPAMGRRVDQRTLVVLAVDLDKRAAELLEHLHAHRLIVDEEAGCAPSASCTRRRISSSSAGISSAASSARGAGWSRATSNTAVT